MWAGLLSEGDEPDGCVLDASAGAGSLLRAVQAMQNGKLPEALQDVTEALTELRPLVADCGAMDDAVQRLVLAVQHTSPSDARANFVAHGAEIMAAITEAFSCQKAEDYKCMGQQLGIALRKILEADGIVI